VGQRQVEVADVFGLDHAGRGDHVEHCPVVAVADHAALRRAGGAGGVDEGADVLRGDRGVALVPDRGVDAGALRGQVLGRERVRVGAGHQHDLLQVRQLRAHLLHLRQLFGVLDDHHLGVGVVEHVAALLGGVGLVDRDHGGADRERREVEVGPLGAGVAEDRDPVALGDAELGQAQRQRPHDLQDLGEAAADPLLAVLVADGRAVAVELGGPLQQVRQRLGIGPPTLHLGGV
jgi:hypothetical protein